MTNKRENKNTEALAALHAKSGKTTYPVLEIFDSVQGEGSMVGQVVTFVRFAGCNLACPWCDTKESWNPENVEYLTSDEIVEKCGQRSAVLTGGEPCTLPLEELIGKLKKANKIIAMETNGTLPTPIGVDWITVSPKPPEYAIHKSCAADEFKYVVDGNFTLDKIEAELLADPKGRVWLQPEGYDMERSLHKAVEMVLAEPGLRLGMQLHKLYDLK